VQDTSEKLGVTAWIYAQPGDSHFENEVALKSTKTRNDSITVIL